MRPLAALMMSLCVFASAAPALSEPHGRGPDRGEEGRGGEGRGGYGGYGGYAPPRGGYPEPRGGYAEPRGAYPEPRSGYVEPRGGYPGPRAPYSEPRPYGYAPPQGRPADAYGGGWGGQQDEVRAGVRQGRYVGLARVIGSIRQRTPGRQLDAGLENWAGRAVYRVRWAEPGGRRIDYIVDAQSGAILHVDGR